MKKLLIVPFLLILCGCSGICKTNFYGISPDKSFCKARTDDWVDGSGELAFGFMCPPLYAYRHNDIYYIFHPVLKNAPFVSAGPALLPVIPVSWFGDVAAKDKYMLALRCYNTNGLIVKSSPKLTISDDATTLSCVSTNREKSYAKGILFTYALDPAIGATNNFDIHLSLPDGEEKTIRYTLKKNLWVCPLFSFNEPPKKPFVYIEK